MTVKLPKLSWILRYSFHQVMVNIEALISKVRLEYTHYLSFSVSIPNFPSLNIRRT